MKEVGVVEVIGEIIKFVFGLLAAIGFFVVGVGLAGALVMLVVLWVRERKQR